MGFGKQPVRISDRLNFAATDKKQRFTEVLDTMQVLYLLQIIPCKNANPYRLWLAECAAAGDNVAKEMERLAEKNAVLVMDELKGMEKSLVFSFVNTPTIRHSEISRKGVNYP